MTKSFPGSRPQPTSFQPVYYAPSRPAVNGGDGDYTTFPGSRPQPTTFQPVSYAPTYNNDMAFNSPRAGSTGSFLH